MNDLQYIRSHYSVPAKRGGRVAYTGDGERQLGTILSARGAHLVIRLDGQKSKRLYHPTWAMEYL